MRHHSDDLRAVSEERIPTPAGFGLADVVVDTAEHWPLDDQRRIDLVCNQRAAGRRRCGQVVVPVSMDGETYEYTEDDRRALVLAHLIQQHGWTREAVGERPAAAQ